MRFKIDENLPVEFAQLLQAAGYSAETVPAEGLGGQPDEAIFAFCQQEQRVLVTLERGFGDIRRYPLGLHAGIIVLRPARQDREMCLALLEQLLPLLREQEVVGRIWIVELGRVRVRSARGS
jgi:predicted nuclease of predicted toxin-antitoxin system